MILVFEVIVQPPKHTFQITFYSEFSLIVRKEKFVIFSCDLWELFCDDNQDALSIYTM